MVSTGLLPQFSFNVRYVRPKANMVNLLVGKLKAVLIVLVNPPLNESCYSFIDFWAVVSGLDIGTATWKPSDWQIKDTLFRAKVMPHSLIRANRIKQPIGLYHHYPDSSSHQTWKHRYHPRLCTQERSSYFRCKSYHC